MIEVNLKSRPSPSLARRNPPVFPRITVIKDWFASTYANVTRSVSYGGSRTGDHRLSLFAKRKYIIKKTEPKIELRHRCGLSEDAWREIAQRCGSGYSQTKRVVLSWDKSKRWQIFAAINDVWTDELPHILELIEGHIHAQAQYNPRPALILDAGAGTGALTLPLICQGQHVVALDPNIFMCRQLLIKAREELPAELRSHLQIVSNKLEDYETQEGIFDVIHSRTVMHTFNSDAMKKFAQALHAKLAPGGLAIVSGLDGKKSEGILVVNSVRTFLQEHHLEEKTWLFNLYFILGATLFPDQHSSTDVMAALQSAGFEDFPINDHNYYHGMGYLIAARKKRPAS